MASTITWRSVDDLFFNPSVYRLLRAMAITRPADRNVLKAAAAAASGSLVAKPSTSPETLGESICLLTEDQLKKHMTRSEIIDRHSMQMPPYLSAWNEKQGSSLLRDDSDFLRNCLPSGQKVVAVDISIKEKLSPQDRYVAIRDSNGRLRTPTRNERRDSLQVYFPLPHRRTVVPSMFAIQKNLDRLLTPEAKKFAYVLDRACIQFEPDDPEFIRIRDRVFNAADDAKAYADLQTTRHFGGLVLHLVLNMRTAGLTSYLIETHQLERCLHLLRLRVTIHQSDLNSLKNFDLPFVLNDALRAFDEQRKIGLLVCLIKLEPALSKVAAPLLEQLRLAGGASAVGRGPATQPQGGANPKR